MIYKQEIYADDEGRAIHAKAPIGNALTEYLGIGNTDDGMGTIVQFEFVVPGYSIEEAFANYDAVHGIAEADCVKQIEAKKKADRQARATPKIVRATAGVR